MLSSTSAIEFAYFLDSIFTVVRTDYEHYRDPLSQTLITSCTRIHNIVAAIESPYDEPNTKGLTSEQKMIVECQLNPGEVLKVKAFAGTGKTKALLEFAKSRPKDKILYVAFNKAAKEDAELRFPFNVKCSTMHGLAYGAILAQADLPQAKLERQLSNSTIASLLSLQVAFPKANRKNNPGTPSASLVASHIMFTLNRFMHSTDWQLGFRHISKRSLEVTKLSKEKLLAYTKKLWSLIVNFEYTHAPLIPDAYMKLLHLYEFPNIFQNMTTFFLTRLKILLRVWSTLFIVRNTRELSSLGMHTNAFMVFVVQMHVLSMKICTLPQSNCALLRVSGLETLLQNMQIFCFH